MSARFLVGDVFDKLAEIPDGSVDLVVTSPPFLALRSYLPADHPSKALEIGSEATPAAFIDVMLAVVAELDRVVAPHGSIVFELGDTFAGSGGAGGDYGEGGLRQGQNGFTGSSHRSRHEQPRQWSGGHGWPLAKSKAMIPELFRVALAYGINPLTGDESPAGRWRVRNVVTWCRPNPAVGALGDKWRPATSDVAVFCRSAKRYWDDVATRQTPSADSTRNEAPKRNVPTYLGRTGDNSAPPKAIPYKASGIGGAPLLDWWEITTGGYKGSHYATFPAELVVPLVKAMCPEKVCRECGEPSRRIVESERLLNGRPTDLPTRPLRSDEGSHKGVGNLWGKRSTTIGWSDCGHDTWRTGVVLDPFAGTGTVLAVATGHSRDAIGIDLDPRNADLALERVGPLLLEVTL